MPSTKIMIAAAFIVVSGAAQAQQRTESDYTQGLQQSALAFVVQNQRGGVDPSNAYVGGRRVAGRLYDEPPYTLREERRAADRRPLYR